MRLGRWHGIAQQLHPCWLFHTIVVCSNRVLSRENSDLPHQILLLLRSALVLQMASFLLLILNTDITISVWLVQVHRERSFSFLGIFSEFMPNTSVLSTHISRTVTDPNSDPVDDLKTEKEQPAKNALVL